MNPKGAFLLLLLLALEATAGLVPRLSFRRGDPRRLVSSFSRNGVQNYDVLLLSPDGGALFVGARDALLALDVAQPDAPWLKGEIPWSPTAGKKEECVFKKKSNETECFNFIRILVPLNETHLYACGTYAFSPTCAFVDLENFTLASDAKGQPLLQEGKGLCPFDPRHPNTVTVVDGELYAGTMNNFQGNEPIISRTLGSRTPLKTDSFLTWLHADASFVGSFSPPPQGPEGDKVYFFFSETAEEFDFFGRLTVPRVARVCKNDVGGDKVLQKKWTTFLKAQLSCCQGPGQLPFTLLRHIAPLPLSPQEQAQGGGGTLFFGVFASQWQGPGPGSSAVCAFSLASLQRAFEGKYKELNKDCSRWVTYSGPAMQPRPGSCGVGPSSDKALAFMKDHFLMEERVAPTLGRPLLVAQGPRYSHLALHRAPQANGRPASVLFLGTDTGFLHKAVVLESGGAHIVEELQLFERPEPVRSLLLAPEKGMLFVGYSKGVLMVPLANCSLHPSCAQCVLARDPYCAWDGRRCRAFRQDTGEDGAQNRTGWVQDVEGGRPEPLCQRSSSSSSSISGRAAPRNSPPEGPPLKELRRPLDSLVRLPCPRSSALANYSWTLPGGVPVGSGEAPPLVLAEEGEEGAGGALVVLVRQEALGRYGCWASENGFRHPVALYRLSSSSSSSPSSPSSSEGQGQGGGAHPVGAEGKGHRAERRSYWAQFVAVTVLLSLALAVAAAVGFFSFHEKLKARSKVQGSGGSGGEKGPEGGQEKAPLNGSQGPRGTKACCVQVDIDADNNRLTKEQEEEQEEEEEGAAGASMAAVGI